MDQRKESTLMKAFAILLFSCPLLFAEAVDMPGQNPGNEDYSMPGINPDDSIFPTPATPPSKAVVPQAQRPGPYGY